MKFRTPKHRYYWLNREGLDIMICGLCGKSRFMGMHSRQPITDLHPICFERSKIIIKYCCGLDINICRILLLSVNTQHLAFNIHKCM